MTTRKNLIKNPSFETNLTGWTAESASIARVSSPVPPPAGGSYVLRLTNTDTPLNNGTARSDLIPVVPGLSYQASAYVYTTTDDNDYNIGLQFLNAAGSSVGGGTSGSTVPSGAWVRRSIGSVAPATATHARVRLNNYDPEITTYYDAVLFEQSDVLGDYFDGDTADTVFEGGTPAPFPNEALAHWPTGQWPDRVHKWDGTAHASTSSVLEAAGSTRDAFILKMS